MSIFIEIRAGEGGDDAKLLVQEQANIYVRAAKLHNLKISVADRTESSITLRAHNCEKLFIFESGGHRWQRIPPNDTRPHSSTVTVAIMEAPRKVDVTIPDHELEISTCKGSGPGGQHRNKTETTVIVKHKPTGIAVRCGGERSQLLNKQTAIRLLAARIIASRTEAAQSSTNKNRKQQVGTGMRADKVRTVQVRNGLVINHLNGKKMPLERYLKGHLEAIL